MQIVKSVFLLVFLLFLSSKSVYSQTGLSIYFDEFLSGSDLKYASASIYIADAQTGDSLFSNKQIHLVPASIMKLVTSAAALELLGPEMKFETLVETTGIQDSISGLLDGDLIIHGSGDPAMGSEFFNSPDIFQEIINSVKRAGIKSIKGSVVADASCFSGQPIPKTWIWEDMGNYYGAGAYGISIYDNYYKIHFKSGKPGTATRIRHTSPGLKELEFVNQVRSSSVNRDLAFVFAAPGQTKQIITGTIPANRKDFVVKAAIPNPPLTFAATVYERLKNAGVEISKDYQVLLAEDHSPGTAPRNVIGKIESPALSEIVYELNHMSVNLFAEALAKKIGIHIKNEGSTSAGTQAIVEFWDSLDCNGFHLADGSGLSRFNAITPQQLTKILVYMNRDSKHKQIFKASLPVAGKNGTMVFYQSPELKGKLLAKTGSMTGVRSFAGYLTTAGGREIAFSFIVNHFNGPSFGMAQKMEKFLVKVYNEL